LREYVANRRREIVGKEAFARALYVPGDQMQFDFTPVDLVVDGVLAKVHLFVALGSSTAGGSLLACRFAKIRWHFSLASWAPSCISAAFHVSASSTTPKGQGALLACARPTSMHAQLPRDLRHGGRVVDGIDRRQP
jgi:hypothetical protein